MIQTKGYAVKSVEPDLAAWNFEEKKQEPMIKD